MIRIARERSARFPNIEFQLADVREKNEWDEGHLPGAVHLPKSYVEQWAEDRIPDKTKTTVLYCAGGTRSAYGAATLGQRLHL